MSGPFIKSEKVIRIQDGGKVVFTEDEQVLYDPIKTRKGGKEVQEVTVKITSGLQPEVDLVKEDGEKLLSFPAVMVKEVVGQEADVHVDVTYVQDFSGMDHLTRKWTQGYKARITWKLEKRQDT